MDPRVLALSWDPQGITGKTNCEGEPGLEKASWCPADVPVQVIAASEGVAGNAQVPFRVRAWVRTPSRDGSYRWRQLPSVVGGDYQRKAGSDVSETERKQGAPAAGTGVHRRGRSEHHESGPML